MDDDGLRAAIAQARGKFDRAGIDHRRWSDEELAGAAREVAALTYPAFGLTPPGRAAKPWRECFRERAESARREAGESRRGSGDPVEIVVDFEVGAGDVAPLLLAFTGRVDVGGLPGAAPGSVLLGSSLVTRFAAGRGEGPGGNRVLLSLMVRERPWNEAVDLAGLSSAPYKAADLAGLLDVLAMLTPSGA